MFEKLVFHKYWSNEEVEYLRDRLIDLIEKSIVLDSGCIIYKHWTENNPNGTIGIKSLSLFPGTKRKTY